MWPACLYPKNSQDFFMKACNLYLSRSSGFGADGWSFWDGSFHLQYLVKSRAANSHDEVPDSCGSTWPVTNRVVNPFPHEDTPIWHAKVSNRFHQGLDLGGHKPIPLPSITIAQNKLGGWLNPTKRVLSCYIMLYLFCIFFLDGVCMFRWHCTTSPQPWFPRPPPISVHALHLGALGARRQAPAVGGSVSRGGHQPFPLNVPNGCYLGLDMVRWC